MAGPLGSAAALLASEMPHVDAERRPVKDVELIIDFCYLCGRMELAGEYLRSDLTPGEVLDRLAAAKQVADGRQGALHDTQDLRPLSAGGRPL